VITEVLIGKALLTIVVLFLCWIPFSVVYINPFKKAHILAERTVVGVLSFSTIVCAILLIWI